MGVGSFFRGGGQVDLDGINHFAELGALSTEVGLINEADARPWEYTVWAAVCMPETAAWTVLEMD